MKRRCSSAGPSDPLLSPFDDVTIEERNYHLPTFVFFDTVVIGIKDPPPIPSLSRCIASLWGELFGTIFLIAVGCSVVCGGQPPLICGFTFGLLLLILIMIFEPISGAKFNPVVSVVFFIENTILIIPSKLLGHYCQNLEVHVANNNNIQKCGDYGSRNLSNVEVLTAVGGLDDTEKSSEIKIRHYLFFFVFMLIECVIQMIGCTIGTYIVKGMIPDAAKYVYGATLLAEGVTPLNGVMLECFMTFFLLYVIFMLDFNYNIHFIPKKDKKTKQKDLIRKTQLTATTVAAVIIILTWLGAQWTGTSLNPARSFGPAFVAWNWESHWIFWVGPPAGGILAWIVWRTFTVFALLNK